MAAEEVARRRAEIEARQKQVVTRRAAEQEKHRAQREAAVRGAVAREALEAAEAHAMRSMLEGETAKEAQYERELKLRSLLTREAELQQQKRRAATERQRAGARASRAEVNARRAEVAREMGPP